MKLLVHTIEMGDVEDPELYAAEPIINWEQTDAGQWLHEHSTQQMEFIIRPNARTYGFMVLIYAWLAEQDLTYFKLKWGVVNVI